MVREMVLNKQAYRNIMAHKATYLGAILMVALSVMLFLGMSYVAANLEATSASYAANNKQSDVEFSTPATLDLPALEARFGALIEEAGVADVVIAPEQTLRLFRENQRVNIPAALEGTLPGAGEIALDPAFAAANGYTIGERLNVVGQEYAVAGYVGLPNYIYVTRSADELVNDAKGFGIGVIGSEGFATLPAAERSYAVRFDDRSGLEAQKTALRTTLGAEGVTFSEWSDTNSNNRVTFVSAKYQSVAALSKVVPPIIFLVTCVMLGLVLWRLVLAESVGIGTLYALGYRHGEIRRHYLVYPAVIAVIGTALGAALGAVLGPALLNFMLGYFPMPTVAAVRQPGVYLVALLGPAVLLCAVTWFVVARILRRPPAQLIKGVTGEEKINVLERHLRLERLGFRAAFQIREQVRNIPRSLLLLLGIVVATMLLLYGLTMKSSMDYLLNRGIRELYNMHYEYVFVEPRTGAPPAGTEPFNATLVTAPGAEEVTFYVAGILPDTQRIGLKGDDGQQMKVDRNIATAPLADQLGLAPGDTLQVFDNASGATYDLVIDAIAATYGASFLFMPLEEFNAMIGVAPTTYTGIWTDEQMEFPASELASTKSLDAVVASYQSLIDQLALLIYALTFTAVAIGLLIIFVVTGMVVEENRTTISLMKVFGYRRGEIGGLVLNSNILLVILGYLLGLPLLLGTVGAFYRSLAGQLKMVIPVRLSFAYMVAGLAVVLGAFLFTVWISRGKVDRIGMSVALKAGTE